MSVDIIVPELGESVLGATVNQWLVKEGDAVQVGEVVVELETDKVNLEVGAEKAGVLESIQVREGEDVQEGDVLGTIDETAEVPTAEPGSESVEEGERKAEKVAAGRESPPEAIPSEPATPVAQRMAKQAGIDLGQVEGTGKDGRVTKADVERFKKDEANQHEAGPEAERVKAEQPAPAEDQEEVEGEEMREVPGERHQVRERMSRRRRTIARRMVEAQEQAAILTTFNEVDMSEIMRLREERNPEFKERYGVKLGITSFFVKAVVAALKEFPRLNAQVDGDDILFNQYYDIGIAIGAEEGLVVPVLRDADQKTFAQLEGEIKGYVTAAQEGSLTLEDLRGGTFSITNGGVFGSLLSTPILNPPQVGILGLHKIERRPIALGDQVVIRPMMYVALSYDHRIVDGREAVQYLVKVKQFIEDPARLLLEI